MSRAGLFAGAFGVLAGAIACGVITIPADPIAPVNACVDNAGCAASFPDASVVAQCFGGSCVGGSSFRPIVIVSVPEGPASPLPGLAGSTFGLPDTYQSTRSALAPACTDRPELFECDFLPPIAKVDQTGSLRVSKGFGVAFWPPGLRPNQPDPQLPSQPIPTSLPIHAIFRPMWVDPVSGVPILARRLGLPLDDRAATVTNQLNTSANTPLYGPTTSPTPQPGFAFGALVPQPISPTDPSATYQVVVVPDSPFDAFPPYVNTLSVAPSQVSRAGQTIGISPFVPIYQLPQNQSGQAIWEQDYEVDEQPGAPSLAGWKVHIDQADGTSLSSVDGAATRISGIVTLAAGATKNIQVWWATGTADQTGQTLFIDPPPGVDLPRYFAPAVGSSIFGPFSYPALPSAVTMSGSVLRAADQTSASAQVVFFANGDPQAYLVEQDGTTSAPQLFYKKTVGTTNDGRISATLPPGVLRAYVIPDDPNLALTLQTLTLTTDASQLGKSLFVNPRTHVRGRVLLPNGTPVFAADVVIDASADDPFSAADDPLARPRESRGTTGVDGRFDVLSDAGLVDISIRPHDGTRLPWVVLTNRTVPPSIPGDAGVADGLTLASDVVVPLPDPFTLAAPRSIVTDSAGYTLQNSVVRAYAFPAAATGAPATRGARLIGATVSDPSLGTFQLFVAPPE